MSEHDANRHLSDTARLRTLKAIDPMYDPLEDTQRMDVYDRRRRQRESACVCPDEPQVIEAKLWPK